MAGIDKEVQMEQSICKARVAAAMVMWTASGGSYALLSMFPRTSPELIQSPAPISTFALPKGTNRIPHPTLSGLEMRIWPPELLAELLGDFGADGLLCP